MYFANSTTVEIFTIAGTIVGSIVLLGLLAAGVGFIWQSFKGGKDQKSNEDVIRQARVDKTLSDLVDAQEKRYQQLDTDHKDNMKQIGILTGKLDEQANQQKWFEGIFIAALDKFFKENPGLAYELDGKIKRGRK